MQMGIIGLNHKTAELKAREEIARAASALAGEKALFFPHATILLSTCNRTEIYFSADDLSVAHSDILALLRKTTPEPFEHRLYSYFGIDCFAHLVHVAAGLDSAIVGESDIQRQVRVAYESAPWLPSHAHYMFQKALKVSKAIRTRFLAGRSAPTVHKAVWQMAERHLGDLRFANILLVGHSATNREMAAFLVKQGVERFTLTTRAPEEVQLAGCTPCDRSALDHWQTYDLILSATQAEGYLISGVPAARHVVFDFSVPRTVDPRLGERQGFSLYNIEEIQRWIAHSEQTDLMASCEQYLWKEVGQLTRSYRERILNRTMLNSSLS